MSNYVKCWTFAPVGARYREILTPAGNGRSSPRRWGAAMAGYVSANSDGIDESYAYSAMPKNMVVVLGNKDAGERAELLRGVKNCVVSEFAGDLTDSQLHLWPLDYWPYVQQFYYGSSFESMPLAGPEMWIDGAKVDFDNMCRACPHYVQQALGMCRPCTTTCTLDKDLFTVKRPAEWLAKHPLDVAYLKSQKVFKYEEFSKLSVQDVFERADFDTITNDADEWGKLSAVRSERSELAAATTRHRKHVCKDCLIGKYSWCSSSGGQGCKEGPFIAEDYKGVAAKCEPWMFWALDLSTRDGTDMREVVLGWRGDRIANHHVVGATKNGVNPHSFANDGMTVRVAKEGRRTLEFDHVPLRAICAHMGIPAKTTWKDIRNFKPGDLVAKLGWPIPEYALALAYLLYQGNIRTYRGTHGWGGGSWLELSSISASFGGRLTLHFRTSSGASDHSSVESLQDCFELDHAGRNFTVMTKARNAENEQLKTYVHEDRLPLSLGRWRQLLTIHPNWRRSPPKPDVLRAILKEDATKARAAAKEEAERKAKKEAKAVRKAEREHKRAVAIAMAVQKREAEAEVLDEQRVDAR